MTQGNRIKTWLSAKEGNVFIENGIWSVIV
jgi:hypothetical protein